ncbi:MAG: DciA family protein [Pseudomonadota bacterium]
MTAKRIDSLIDSALGGSFGEIAEKAGRMDKLAAALKKSLDPELASGIRAANLRDDGTLVVLCTNAAYAARLRFETDALAAAAGDGVTRVTVRVAREA